MEKEEWLKKAMEILCEKQGFPLTETQSMREWAEALFDYYYGDGLTPMEAVEEDLSYL